MSGKLKNRTRRALTFNLTTKVAPVRQLFDRRVEHKDGSTSVAQRRLVFPDSVTVLAGKLSDSLPDGAPHCPEVAAAIARRDVEWVPDEPASSSKPSDASESPAPEAAPASSEGESAPTRASKARELSARTHQEPTREQRERRS